MEQRYAGGMKTSRVHRTLGHGSMALPTTTAPLAPLAGGSRRFHAASLSSRWMSQALWIQYCCILGSLSRDRQSTHASPLAWILHPLRRTKSKVAGAAFLEPEDRLACKNTRRTSRVSPGSILAKPSQTRQSLLLTRERTIYRSMEPRRLAEDQRKDQDP
jgi:hypothetical protein